MWGNVFLCSISLSAADGATVTTTADAPPGYTEVVKGQKPVEIQLPGQPQLMFVQAGPHAQPGTFIQPVQYMVRVYVNCMGSRVLL